MYQFEEYEFEAFTVITSKKEEAKASKIYQDMIDLKDHHTKISIEYHLHSLLGDETWLTTRSMKFLFYISVIDQRKAEIDIASFQLKSGMTGINQSLPDLTIAHCILYENTKWFYKLLGGTQEIPGIKYFLAHQKAAKHIDVLIYTLNSLVKHIKVSEFNSNAQEIEETAKRLSLCIINFNKVMIILYVYITKWHNYSVKRRMDL